MIGNSEPCDEAGVKKFSSARVFCSLRYCLERDWVQLPKTHSDISIHPQFKNQIFNLCANKDWQALRDIFGEDLLDSDEFVEGLRNQYSRIKDN